MSAAAPGEGLRKLACFAATTDTRQLPADVATKAQACLLYALTVGIASLPAAQAAHAARAVAQAYGGSGESTRFYDDAQCNAVAAALANGTLFHSRVQDDAHPAGHVGVVVVPTALAMAEATNASGAALLAALVSGYETALRIGRDHAGDLSARGFRTTPAYGVFGAAAAAGRLLGLHAEGMTHALSLAANMAGGLRDYSQSGSEDFAFQAGMAASNGILAARLAAAGATSAPSALYGNAGFFRAYGEPGARYADRLASDLGRMFEMMAVTYKPYPICQFHRSVVRGCCVLRERAGGAPFASLSIRMHPFEADFFGVRFAGPFSTFPQTFMSAPFCAALAWARGDATLAGLTDFHAADVLNLVPRISIHGEHGRPRYAPRLEARFADAPVLEWEERDRSDPYVLTWETACRMAARLSAEVGGTPEGTERLVSIVRNLDAAPDVRPLIDAMRDVCRSVSGAQFQPA